MADTQSFDKLRYLLSAWFHQDFDITGNTLEEIIGSYKSESTPEDWTQLRGDIAAFLALHPEDAELTGSFMQTFHPDLIERPFGLTIRQFLRKIASMLD